MLDVAEGIAGGGGRAAVTAIVGTAGDRPDDTLRGIARIAAARAQRVAIKETLHYLRGRTREAVVGEMLAGVAGGTPSEVPVCSPRRPPSARNWPTGTAGRGHRFCHEEREAVFALLEKLGAKPIDLATELTTLVPRLQERPRRG